MENKIGSENIGEVCERRWKKQYNKFIADEQVKMDLKSLRRGKSVKN